MKKRLLFIAHRVPYPPDKGERVRAFNEIKALASRFRVVVAALAHSRSDRDSATSLKQWCEKVIVAPAGGKTGLCRGVLSVLAGGSVTEGFFRSPRMERALREESRAEAFDVVMGYSSGVLDLVLKTPARAHVLDLVDVDSAKWQSYADKASWPLRWFYKREAAGVRRIERRAVDECDAALVVTDAEAKAMLVGGEKLTAVPNGVDLEYFAPCSDISAGPPSLVFTGTMDYRPNIDGVSWFVREVWPRLKQRVPDLRFNIVGRDPARAVMELGEISGIHVTGTVPDVRPYLGGACVAVVPLRIARGIQNKVLEAMAMGRAVVASGPALEGLEVTAGEEVFRADTVEEWHNRVLTLLSDDAFRRRMEQRARRCVESRYNWDAQMGSLVDLCTKLAEHQWADGRDEGSCRGASVPICRDRTA